MKKETLELEVGVQNTKKPLLILVFLLAIYIFGFSGLYILDKSFRPDFIVIVIYFSLYLFLFLNKRKKDIVFLLISTLVALVWILLTNNLYGYNREMMDIFGYNSFPLFAWSSGLTMIFLVYSEIEEIFIKERSKFARFFIFSVMYFVLILSFETLGYHVFNIRNNATALYSGLPICDCIHAPHWMQASYLLFGPFYYLLCLLYKEKVLL